MHPIIRVSTLCCCLAAGHALAAEPQQLHGHVPAATAHLKAIGRLDPDKELNLALSSPLRNQDELTALLQSLYDPASTNFHKFLTPDQFARRFGPSERDYEVLAAFAKANGLHETTRHPNRVILDVKGSVANIEKALHIKLLLYNHPKESRTFFAPDLEP